MPFCPNCDKEYDSNVKFCKECGEQLLELAEDDTPYEEDLALIATFDEMYKAEMLVANLESADIKAYILSQKDSVLTGVGDLAIVKVFVDRKNFDAAVEFVESVENTPEEDDEE